MGRVSSVVFALLVSVALVACGGGGGGGGSPPVPNVPAAEVELNNTFATANALSATGSGSGTLLAGDVDFWSFSATANSTIRVELHALRADQTTWDINANDPMLTLLDTDGVTKLLEHDRVAEGWPYGPADLDFPAFHVPATGGGTYFLQVMASFPLFAGGNYVVIVKSITTPGTFQTEIEGPGLIGVNDGSLTAQAIVPGTIFGWHVDNNSDFYKFTTTGPTIVSFEMLAYRNGLSRIDPNLTDTQLTLYTPGLVVIQNNDFCFLSDPGLTYLIRTAGTYFIQVSESPATAGDGEYYLFYTRVGVPLAFTESEPNNALGTADSTNYNSVTYAEFTAPFETDVFKFFGNAGDVVAVQQYDLTNAESATFNVLVTILDPVGVPLFSSFGPNLEVTRAILQTTGDHYVQVQNLAAGPTRYWFRLLRLFGSIRESEPNDTVPTADSLGSSKTVSGVINPAGNVDHFSFGAEAGEVVTIHCFGGAGLHAPWTEQDFDQFGSPLFPRLCIFDPAALLVAISNHTPAGGMDSTQSMTDGLASVSVTYVVATAGNHTVQVSDQLAGGGASFLYVLERR